jgi:hypothetical protein
VVTVLSFFKRFKKLRDVRAEPEKSKFEFMDIEYLKNFYVETAQPNLQSIIIFIQMPGIELYNIIN